MSVTDIGLAALACWILLSGLDDLFVMAVWLASLGRRGRVCDPPRAGAETRRIAIFLPLWREAGVIGSMIDHNTAAIRYGRFDIFAGVYPNDTATLEAVQKARRRVFNLHVATCPHVGPTSKADCLNWIYQCMLRYEEESGERFDVIVTHDAEDLIHPESLLWIDRLAEAHGMAQVPVLPLPTGWREFTHGVYCDEFAEYQIKDIPARQWMGGFIPSNGVGTGFTRDAIEALAARFQNRIFEPECLTEDYENGYRVHALGFRQTFLPLRRRAGTWMATREYFPRTFRSAVRQRTRWTVGIALQSWERHGWRDTLRQGYWFFRDRKGLVGNLLSPVANLLFVYGAVTWVWHAAAGTPWPVLQAPAPVRWLMALAAPLPLIHLAMRMACCALIYGWRFALGVPLRAPWGNLINFVAALAALRQYAAAKAGRRPLVWVKTEHQYPSRAALMPHKRRLGEILTGSGYLSPAALDDALASLPAGVRLGEHLIALGLIALEHLYEALSLQQSLPFGVAAEDLSYAATRALPARVARQWKVLPFRIEEGALFVAGPELPCDGLQREIRRFSSLEVRFHLVTPAEWDDLASRYLPA